MQLKVTNTFNVKLVKQLLIEEDKFISDVFSLTFSPVMKPENDEVDEKDNEVFYSRRNKTFSLTGEKPKRAQTFEELQAKLDELKNKAKLDHKERNLKKGLQNKVKKKLKAEQRQMQYKQGKSKQNITGASEIKERNGQISKIPKQKPIFNSEGHMVFSKFDFSQFGRKRKVKTEKNPKKILEQIKQKKQKIEELVESGRKAQVEEIMEKEAWKSTLAKASGEKVKDDPELLRKSIRRNEQKKKQCSRKWESRIKGVEKSIQERQQKRKENIMNRKKEKKSNKLKKAAKKGRIVLNN